MKGRGQKMTWPASAMGIAAPGFQMDNNDPAGGWARWAHLTKSVMGKVQDEIRQKVSGSIPKGRAWASFCP